MRTLNLKQGEPGWHAHRATARNASDASAVLGCSPYTTRSELLHQRHTGLRPEVDAAVQRRFDDGHAIEAAQLPGAEEIVGESLYPVVGVAEVDGIELSASFDGITMAEDAIFECKTVNDELRSCLPKPGTDDNDGRDLPKHYRVQMEQQLAVSGAERVLFVAASKDGAEVRRCWYYPDPALRAEIIAGWKQFEADLAVYVPPAPSVAERIVAEPVQALPAVSVQVAGQITVQDNFRVFEERLRDFLDNRLIRQPKTDQDFADLDVQIKAMKGAEAALDAAEAQMLAQIQTVDQAKKTKDMLAKLVRDNRLMAEKLLASEKERRRGEIVAGGISALKAHIEKLNERLGRPYMPATATAVDFGEAIKGKKSLASMEDAVATELARAKIEANEIADRIQTNLTMLREQAADHAFLFADTAQLVLKTPEDCQAQITNRIAEHRAAEERRAAELAERERARIRAEEETRAREQAQREQQEREAAERRQREEAAARELAEAQAKPGGAELSPAAQVLNEQQGAERFAKHYPTIAQQPANVHPLPTRAPAPAGNTQPTLTLGEIKKRLAPLSIDDAGLTSLGFPPAKQEGAAKLRHEHSFPGICDALIATIARAKLKEAA